MSIILGINLGTTNSCMAYVDENGRTQVITNAEGERTTPSVIGFDEHNQCLIGSLAKNMAEIRPDRTFRSVKTHMGKTREKLLSVSDYPKYTNKKGEIYLPQDISSLILGKLKADAEMYLGKQIRQEVITVPAYFNDMQRNAIKDAGKIAGLDVIRVINEPTAAAIAYGLDHAGKDQTILVYDLGGGTFDVSIMNMATDSEIMFDVISTIGDTCLGGDNFDELIMNHIFADIQAKTGVNVFGDSQSRQKIKSVAEDTKKKLSNVQKASIGINNIGPDHTINYTGTLERSLFEEMIKQWLKKNSLVSPLIVSFW